MTKLEKVIDALKHCELYGYCNYEQCPYYKYAGCLELLRNDVLELLKTQEPVSPTIKQEMDDICSCIDNVAYCGRCGARIGRLKQNYCSNCGQAVKWDERSAGKGNTRTGVLLNIR